MTVVVDTNVVVVANGKSQQASASCVTTCIERLQQIIVGEMKLVLDDNWRILGEYIQKSALKRCRCRRSVSQMDFNKQR